MNVPASIDLQPGNVFGGCYKIIRRLSEGNFGCVYEAVQTVHGVKLRRVALKVFKEERVNLDTASEQFEEAVTLVGLMEDMVGMPRPEVRARLVEILGGGVADVAGQSRLYLSMEFVNGKPLDAELKHYRGMPGVGGLPVDLAQHYLREILIPLAWMHTLPTPVVHGDLHFGNVLVAKKASASGMEIGSVKLVDFGLARHLPGPVTGGALKCQAPETLTGGLGDTRSDVYAVGILWYELLTGQYPFQDERAETTGLELAALTAEVDAMKKKLKEGGEPGLSEKTLEAKEQVRSRKQQEHIGALVAARKRPYTQASEINETLHGELWLEDILNRCLDFSPARRFFDAKELQKALEKHMAGEATPFAVKPKPLAQPEPPPAVKPPPLLKMRLDQALRLAQRGQFVLAQAEADKALAQEPNAFAAWLAKANIALSAAVGEPAQREHQLDQANEFLAKAQALAPEEPLVFDAWVEFLRADGKPDRAKQMQNQADSLRRNRAKGK